MADLASSSGKDAANVLEGRQITVNKSGTKTFTTDTNTQFPYNLPSINDNLFAIVFQCYKFDRSSIMVGGNLIPYGSISLPMPTDLVDRSAISYNEDKLGLAVGSGLLAAENIWNATQGSIADKGAAVTQAATSGAINTGGVIAGQAIGGAINKALGGNVTGAVGTVVGAVQGLAQNPFLTVLFNAPTFKRHVFNWMFVPENAQDTENLNFILNKLRYHMHPGILGGINVPLSIPDSGVTLPGSLNVGQNMLMTYPDMIMPTLLPLGYLYDYKYCVIEGMSVDYAPGNLPSFFPTNAPSGVRLTLSLLEIEFWTKGDFLGKSNNGRTYYSGG